MEQSLNQIFTQLLTQSTPFLYLFLFGVAVLENVFPPIPGDTVTAFGAFLVGTGKLDFWMVYAVTTIGSTTGFFLLYSIARYFGIEFFQKSRFKWFNKEKMDITISRISRYGYLVITVNRFIFAARSVISISAGILRLKRLPVLILSFISAALWNLIWIRLGFSLGNNWDAVKIRLLEIFHQYNFVSAVILCALIILILAVNVYKYLRNRKNRASSGL
ncbi:MAG: DedA family protein [Spirochaetota bacterium]